MKTQEKVQHTPTPWKCINGYLKIGSKVWREGIKYEVFELAFEKGIQIAKLRPVDGHGYEWFDAASLELVSNLPHTATPWDYDGEHIGQKDTFRIKGPIIATVSIADNWEANAAFIVRAVNSHEKLLEFAKLNHETCGECEGTGKVYNNADPTSGQWVYCPYAEAIAQAEGRP